MISIIALSGVLAVSAACLAFKRRRKREAGCKGTATAVDVSAGPACVAVGEKEACQAANVELLERVAFLCSIPLFRLLPRDELPMLAMAFEVRTYAAGSRVAASLEVADIFVVRSGKAAAMMGTGLKALGLEEGDVFGGGLLRQASAQLPMSVAAESDCSMLRLGGFVLASCGLDQRLSFAGREVSWSWADTAVISNMRPSDTEEASLREAVLHLRMLPAVCVLLAEEVRALARQLTQLRLSEGDVVLEEGRIADSLFILWEGQVTTSGVEEVPASPGSSASVQLLGAWEFFRSDAVSESTVRVTSSSASFLVLARTTYEKLPEGTRAVLERWHFFEHCCPKSAASNPFRKRIQQSDLVEVGLLGSGGFARVDLVEHVPSGTTFALRSLGKGSIARQERYGSLQQERCILMMTDSPFVVKLWETYSGPTSLFFLLEVALGGELHQTYKRHNLYGSEPHAKFYAACATVALAHLHTRFIVYRSLKPENMLLDPQGYAKITDFDLARFVVEKTFTTCGTPDYFAPEQISANGSTRGTDWWALGILVYEMLSGSPPFEAPYPLQICSKVLRGIDKVQFADGVRFGAESLVRGLLTADPQKRLPMQPGGIANIRRHPWLEDFDWEALSARKASAPHKPEVEGPKDFSNINARVEDCPRLLHYEEDGSGWDANFATA